MKGVFLDAETLRLERRQLDPIREALEALTCHDHTDPEQRVDRLADADVALINKVVLDAAVLEQARHLRLICIAATGFNNVDVAAAARLGMTVTHCRAYGTDSVAQHVFTLILTLATSLPRYTEAVRQGDWGRSRMFCLLDYPIMELAGKRLGIVGYGTLGRRVAELGRAFGMEVLISQRPDGDDSRPERVPLTRVIEESDVLSLHCPLNEATRGLIGAGELAAMRPGAILVNAARGGIVDERALADALRTGEIAGAGVDVLSEEPPARGNALLADDIPNLIVTPHSAWGSLESRLRIVRQVAENIDAFKRGEPLRVVPA